MSERTPTDPVDDLARVRIWFRGFPILDPTTSPSEATVLAGHLRQRLVGVVLTVAPAEAPPAHTDGPVQ